MESEGKEPHIQNSGGEGEDTEPVELVLFQVSECYVYIIPPRKTASSYRADEWDVNKWAWEGILKVVSKGEECIIRLEDKKTGELYARAFLRKGEPHPVEPVIDSSRYFVLRIEENIDGRLRHAFIGIGFRERTEAYDFQAALHDHMKYLNKKQTAEEMEQHYQQSSSVDYSLKEGETIVLQLKNSKSGRSVKSKFFEQSQSNFSEEKGGKPESTLSIKLPPPPPPGPLSPAATIQKSPTNLPPKLNLEKTSEVEAFKTEDTHQNSAEDQSTQDIPDDDFGDFQAAG
ncbi:hypothetical protein HN51_046533 [Arachis hypogaea]|uniref:uncharacterized protein At1g03900 n=1 Tax=Arachis ipaensis TaxID=130454 RepID=UPI0007AF6654|nr:uncharacterized protein At1g03900 [Arachis ipaensis]XP_025631926.1 uncharacterized protein At1g03900 [Arachis hypogaea]QHO22711.1 Adaptin ear-binding coat-associated protein [Arachis hypogaea]